MRLIADLHVHSKYSRATSRDMDLDTLALWASIKGIGVVGTGDFTHPAHFKSIEEKLEDDGGGLLVLKKEKANGDAVRFMLTAEVSGIYSQGNRTRKVHSLILAPSVDAARKINAALGKIGNLASDGRPILGLSAADLLKITLDASPEAMLIPAHAWTPWFSVFGSKSGFDSLEECFGDLTKHIHAIETGLSSNPAMNRRLKRLDDVALISNSDAHSPSKLGREANVLDCEATYAAVTGAIRSRDPKRFLYTIEFYPEEGKYHSDGHSACAVLFTPEETRRAGGRCPVCGGPITVGVLARVEELADRPVGAWPEGAIPARHLVPLEEIIAEVLDAGVKTVKVQREYRRLCAEAGSEFNILLDMETSEMERIAGARAADAVGRVRRGELNIRPGFDGEFGVIRIFERLETPKPTGPAQIGLF